MNSHQRRKQKRALIKKQRDALRKELVKQGLTEQQIEKALKDLGAP